MLGTFQRDLKAYVARVKAAWHDDNRDLDGLPPAANDNLSGWEGRSDASITKRYVVFEVGGIAAAAAFRGWALGEGLAFKSLQGSWKGRHNPAFIAEDTGAIRFKLAYWLRGQEAILCLGPAWRDGQLWGNREAVLDYLDIDGYQVTRREPLDGLWQAVSKETAAWQDSWTFDPLENQYYAVVPVYRDTPAQT